MWDLIPGGRDVVVTNSSVISYIHLMAHFKLNVQTARPCKAFLQGFRYCFLPRLRKDLTAVITACSLYFFRSLVYTFLELYVVAHLFGDRLLGIKNWVVPALVKRHKLVELKTSGKYNGRLSYCSS